jgi:LCP family protein required for cell wall assembly
MPVSPARRSPLGFLCKSLALMTVGVASAAAGLSLAMMTPLPSMLAPSNPGLRPFGGLWHGTLRYKLTRPVNVLVMGIDRVPDAKAGSPESFSGRSDTMLLLHLDPTDASISMLSIPRDTQVQIPSEGTVKINHANVAGGPALAAQVVSKTLNDVPVDRYVRVSTDAFRELVDLLGGVRVYVPKPMSYTDQTQKLKIDLKQGWQTLNGSQAEQFARFRNDAYGDIGRVQRQQALLKALRGQLINPMVIPRIPRILTAMQKYIDTNLTPEEILALVNMGLGMEKDNFKMVMLPGRFSAPDEFIASYWIMDLAGRDRVMQDYFKLGKKDAASTRTASALRIAVQNASGNSQAGSQMLNRLSNLGFYNAYLVDDWSESQAQTEIIVQQGDLAAATDLQKAIGVGQIEAASIGDLESDLTIRIGKDWLSQ